MMEQKNFEKINKNLLESTHIDIVIEQNTIKLFIILLLIGIHAVISMYSSIGSPYAQFMPEVSTFYLSAALIVLTCLWLGPIGLLIVLIASFIHTISLGMSVGQSILWSIADVFEGLIPLIAQRYFKLPLHFTIFRRNHGQQTRIIMILLALFICPFGFKLLYDSFNESVFIYLVGAFLSIFLLFALSYTLKIIRNMLIYILFAIIIPSLIGGSYGSWRTFSSNIINFQEILSAGIVWISSNIMIVAGFTTLILYLGGDWLCRTRDKIFNNKTKEPSFRIEAIIYSIALLIWIYLFVVLFASNWLGSVASIFLIIPCLLGAIVLGINALSAQQEEVSDPCEAGRNVFDQLEGRVIVAEKNTEIVLLVLSILLPIVTIILKQFSRQVLCVLIATVTLACSAIAIIWVPRGAIWGIRVLKAIKTTLHLYTVSLLLLASILILTNLK